MRSRAILLLLGVCVLSGCGGGDGDGGGGGAPDRGSIVVTVTLTRSGPPGPSIDHVPQHDVEVTVTNTSGHSWSAKTDDEGEAQLSVPVGDYEVDTGFCPDAPKPVSVTTGTTARVRFDCVAP